MKRFYNCPRCTFKGWVSGDSPTCRDCEVPLERRELVYAELELGEFGLVKWASKRARAGESMHLTDFIHECLVEHSLNIVRVEFKAGRAVPPGIAGMLNGRGKPC
jgi:hypothetical protein